MTTETVTRTVTVTARQLHAAVEQTVPVTDKGSGRLVLQGVRVLATTEGVLRFEACDSFALVVVRLPLRGSLAFDAILDAAALKAQAPAIKRAYLADVTLTLAEDGRSAELGYPTGTATIPVIEGTYPNLPPLTPLLDQPERSRFGVNGGLLGGILTRAAKHAASGIVRVYPPKLDSSPVRLDWKNDADGWTATGAVMPMVVNWAEEPPAA